METSRLLPGSQSLASRERNSPWLRFGLLGFCLVGLMVLSLPKDPPTAAAATDRMPPVDIEGSSHHHHHHHDDTTDDPVWKPTLRCGYIEDIMLGDRPQTCTKHLTTYAKDYNTFYRATAKLFWLDFAKMLNDGRLLQFSHDTKSVWTWTTGDQHLSNFGAWKNRHSQIVFTVNDFDEAALYDFQIDVLRVAVSMVNHGQTNGLHVEEVLFDFCDTYVNTVVSYLGNEKAQTFELTAETASGMLQDFLQNVEHDNSHEELMSKYTELNDENDSYSRRFVHTKKSKLEPLDNVTLQEMKDAFSAATRYRATMMKTGWHVHEWDDDYFYVLDAAARVGSGVGSYGVDRYYVLLHGNSDEGEPAIVLDVKYEPKPAVSLVLDEDDQAWYDVLFANEAARVVQGQRHLTSYVDPFTGWVILDGKAFAVRQRSPWKDSPDLEKLTDLDNFAEFMEQIAMVTATSHVRGTVSRSPGQFKDVLASVLQGKVRKQWSRSIVSLALSYHQQVLLDYECYRDYMERLGC